MALAFCYQSRKYVHRVVSLTYAHFIPSLGTRRGTALTGTFSSALLGSKMNSCPSVVVHRISLPSKCSQFGLPGFPSRVNVLRHLGGDARISQIQITLSFVADISVFSCKKTLFTLK